MDFILFRHGSGDPTRSAFLIFHRPFYVLKIVIGVTVYSSIIITPADSI